LFAVRKGAYKAHFTTHVSYVGQKAVTHDPPLLFNLDIDPSESRDIAQGNPEVVAQLRQLADEFQASFEAPPSQLEARISR
jgi:arylsulfatase A